MIKLSALMLVSEIIFISLELATLTLWLALAVPTLLGMNNAALQY